jgi:NDP-sugar pyrophosphorylase family protein
MADLESNPITDTTVVVLAAGLGTRLRDVVSDRPKPMADMNGRPFLDYVVTRLASFGFGDIVICVGYMKEHIIDYFSKNYQGQVRFSIEGEPQGTGVTLKNAAKAIPGRFIVLNGDSYTIIDYNELLSYHIENKADITIALYEAIGNKGRVTLDGKRIIEFTEISETALGLLSTGVCVMEHSILDRIAENDKSFQIDTIPRLLEDKSIVINGYLPKRNIFTIDMGTPESYKYLLQNTKILEE